MIIFRSVLSGFLCLMVGLASAQPRDTLVAVGAYKLHVRTIPGAEPAILFESGGGLDASQWDSIATVVHHRLGATVITYDRAGFGQSTLDTTRYRIAHEIEGLETALEKLGYRRTDFLLVGHSLGAFYNRLFAARHPRQVKGIILLDPRIPSRADAAFARRYFQGLHRADFDGDYLNLYRLLARMEGAIDDVGRVPLPTSIPLLDIMAERGPSEDASENKRFQADQRNLVRAAKNRRLLLARGSSHNIPHDRPGLVIEQIVAFYKKHARGRAHRLPASPR